MLSQDLPVWMERGGERRLAAPGLGCGARQLFSGKPGGFGPWPAENLNAG